MLTSIIKELSESKMAECSEVIISNIKLMNMNATMQLLKKHQSDNITLNSIYLL